MSFAQSHYRQLQQRKLASFSFSDGDFDSRIELDDSARSELQCWAENLHLANGMSIEEADPDLIIFSDASLRGWGATSDGIIAFGPWSNDLAGEYINYLELLAAFNAIQSFTPASLGLRIKICMDNATAVVYLNKSGGARSWKRCRLAQEIAFYCEKRKLTIRATHLPGTQNSVGDRLSRSKPDFSDWRLNTDVFQKIASYWRINFDLFAMEWNAQVPTYISWFPQPTTRAVNAILTELGGSGRVSFSTVQPYRSQYL